MKRLILILGFCTLPLLVSAWAFADSETNEKTLWIGELTRSVPEEKQLQGLSFISNRIPVTLAPRSEVLRPMVEIHGIFNRPGWQLFYQGIPLLGKFPDPREFKFYIFLTSQLTQVTLIAKGPLGETESEPIVIVAPQAQEFRLATSWGDLLFSLGMASLGYFQTGYGNFKSLTGMFSFHYLTPKWKSAFGIDAEFKSTLLTVSSNPSNLGPQIIGGKIDGTYHFSNQTLQPLNWNLIFGISYVTMLSNGSPFGFANLASPEVGAKVAYSLGAHSSVFGEFRYMFLGNLFDFTQSQVDLRAGWTTRLRSSHRIELGVSYSALGFLQNNNSISIQSNLLSGYVGYTF